MPIKIFLPFGVAFFLLAIPFLSAEAAENPKVLLQTTKGDITIELYQDKAPITVKNLLSYVDKKFYDGTIFHRVIKGFMIQGGGLTADFVEKLADSPIKNEAANGLKNLRGTIAMARMPEIHSATCQFFINHVDNAYLDHRSNTPEGYGYAVFGKIIKGLEVVDAIAASPTGTIKGNADAPRQTITILSVKRLENK
ncbi:MAG: peptidylprolyl isomerase [Candidatus Aminicenantales bacterium]